MGIYPGVDDALELFLHVGHIDATDGPRPGTRGGDIDTLIGAALLIAGIAVLDRGADWFVDSATALAQSTRLPLVLVGLLTVGIEWEELAVVVAALIEGREALAFGALVGSAIANVTIVLGAGALLHPLQSGPIERRLAVILMLGTLLLGLLGGLGSFGMPEGILLLIAYAGYLLWLAHQIRIGRAPAGADDDEDADSVVRLAVMCAGGLVLAIAGGEAVVHGGVRLAAELGLTQTTIGLTFVALGTSLPDAITSIRSARRGAPALVLANTAGSNLCNLLLLIGLVAVTGGVEVPGNAIDVDIPVLLTFTILFVWVSMRRAGGRGYALVLIGCYLVYVWARIA